MPFLEARGLVKSYTVGGTVLTVLRDLDLEVQAGEMVAIVGASGVGKSTLLHLLGGLDRADAGAIAIDGARLTVLDDAEVVRFRNHSVGFVFQFHHLLPEFSAVENVMMPGLIRGDAKKKMEQRARELLAEVGLSHRETHRPGEMSGGEQQRVAIARALTLEPKLLLADEPTGNLDTATSDAVHDLFFEINEKHGTTIVVVTHNPSFAQRMPRVVEMSDGKIVRDQRGSLARAV